MKLKFLIPVLMFSFVGATGALSAVKEISEKHNIGGYIHSGTTVPYQFSPHRNPRALPNLTSDTKNRITNKKTRQATLQYLEKFPATTAIILIDNGKILLEEYRGKANKNSEFFSMSIGKSMTSLALGKALCSGKIDSLEIRANTLVPELGNSGFGRSTIRQLLMMSSGAYKSIGSGQPRYKGGIGRNPRTSKPFSGHSWPLRLGQVTVADVLWGHSWKTVLNKNPSQPGEIFNYKSGDILSIGKIIERVTGMSTAAYFDQTVWQEVRGGKTGHWESDSTGTTLTNSSFQVSLKDWGRIAVWILEELKKPGCYQKYLQAATSQQIAIPHSRTSSFLGYGYQWWTNTTRAPGFWGLGYAGQMLAINPKTGKVLIKFSYRQDAGSGLEIMKIFKDWNIQSN